MSVTYFDYAATTPVSPQAMEAVVEALQHFGNPSSQYPLGLAAKKRTEADRAVIASALGCKADQLYFTSCGTEGDNWAIQGAVELGRRLLAAQEEDRQRQEREEKQQERKTKDGPRR